jgi:predicted ester cyclase
MFFWIKYMNNIDNKKLIIKLHDIWNSNNISAVPEVYSNNVVVHWSKSSENANSLGHVGIRQAITDTLLAFPDWQEKFLDIIAEDDKVVTRYVSTGTHMGTYQGIAPTGNKIKVDEISIFCIKNGKVMEQWCLVDDLALVKQLETP